MHAKQIKMFEEVATALSWEPWAHKLLSPLPWKICLKDATMIAPLDDVQLLPCHYVLTFHSPNDRPLRYATPLPTNPPLEEFVRVSTSSAHFFARPDFMNGSNYWRNPPMGMSCEDYSWENEEYLDYPFITKIMRTIVRSRASDHARFMAYWYTPTLVPKIVLRHRKPEVIGGPRVIMFDVELDRIAPTTASDWLSSIKPPFW